MISARQGRESISRLVETGELPDLLEYESKLNEACGEHVVYNPESIEDDDYTEWVQSNLYLDPVDNGKPLGL